MNQLSVSENVRVAERSFFAVSSLITIFLAVAVSSFAQLTQPRRYEKIHKNSDEPFTVISLKEEGLALYRDMSKFKNNNRTWELTLLDTALQEKKTLEIEIKERNHIVGYEYAPGHVYFVFRTGETTKNDFELIDIDL